MSAGLSVRCRPRSPGPTADEIPPFAVRRFTVEEYHRLIDAGILRDGDPYELLDGWITRKSTLNPAHDVCVDLLTELFMKALPKGWRPRIPSAVALGNSEPEPDVTVVFGSARDFSRQHPTPETIALVMEVADSSVERDRHKGRLYAHEQIPRYWLINLAERVIEDHSQPAGKGSAARYKNVRKLGANDVISLKIGRKSLSFPVRDVLP